MHQLIPRRGTGSQKDLKRPASPKEEAGGHANDRTIIRMLHGLSFLLESSNSTRILGRPLRPLSDPLARGSRITHTR
jgi:hypothetical protein